MAFYVEFDSTQGVYVRTGDRPNFSSGTKKTVTEEYNTTHGTGYNYRKPFARANNLSIDHKLAWKVIADRVVAFLNQCHAQLSPSGHVTVAAAIKSFRGEFLRYLYKGDDKTPSKTHPGTGTRKTNPEYKNVKQELAFLEAYLKQCYKPDGLFAAPNNDYGSVSAAANALLKALNDSVGNLRYGNSGVNSSIGEDFDGHAVRTPGHGHVQFTPHTKEQMGSSWAQHTQFMMTPSGDHFLTSDFINPIARATLTPDSRQRFDEMET